MKENSLKLLHGSSMRNFKLETTEKANESNNQKEANTLRKETDGTLEESA